MLTVTGKIVWTASCWFAPTIEIETWAGLEKYFDAMKVLFWLPDEFLPFFRKTFLDWLLSRQAK